MLRLSIPAAVVLWLPPRTIDNVTTMRRASPLLLVLLGLCALPLGGCASVQAWDKGNLAKPAMAFTSDPLDDRYTQHIYTSKENASGGYGVGGGGCGCN
jgi:hypothetical protein